MERLFVCVREEELDSDKEMECVALDKEIVSEKEEEFVISSEIESEKDFEGVFETVLLIVKYVFVNVNVKVGVIDFEFDFVADGVLVIVDVFVNRPILYRT
jgi:hypothetical protein